MVYHTNERIKLASEKFGKDLRDCIRKLFIKIAKNKFNSKHTHRENHRKQTV